MTSFPVPSLLVSFFEGNQKTNEGAMAVFSAEEAGIWYFSMTARSIVAQGGVVAGPSEFNKHKQGAITFTVQ